MLRHGTELVKTVNQVCSQNKNRESGVQSEQITEFEDTFNVNVNLFSIDESGNGENVYNSRHLNRLSI